MGEKKKICIKNLVNVSLLREMQTCDSPLPPAPTQALICMHLIILEQKKECVVLECGPHIHSKKTAELRM